LGWISFFDEIVQPNVGVYRAKRATRNLGNSARLARTRLTTKVKTQLHLLYVEFESTRVESQVTCLNRKFRVLSLDSSPNLNATSANNGDMHVIYLLWRVKS
jgi:hypothetical protein